MKLLEGKVGIVTGGAKGLGHGISRRMAREGASLLITGRDGAATEKVAAEIRDEFGTQAIGISADVGIKEQIEAMVERAVSEFGGLDILVNNASQLSPNILLEHKTDEMLKRTLEIGTWGTWWAMRAAFPHMKARGGGAIVNFYSIDAQTGAWLHSAYNMNKGAILGLTRSAAVEWGRFNIRTNPCQHSPNILLEKNAAEMVRGMRESGTGGTCGAMRAAFPNMKGLGGGAIVNFYSIDAQTGAWLHSDYNMNKGAILGLTRSAAVEWGRFNIRTNAIAPTGLGQVFAQLVNDVPGFLEMATASNPLKRAGDPENDIGPVVVFLASDMASFVNGELINVDGGQHLPGYVSVPHNLDELEAQS